MNHPTSVGLLTEYEAILLGKRKEFSPTYLGANTRQVNAIRVFQFAFEELLQWTPGMVRDYTTLHLIELLHLKKPLGKLKFPPELDKKNDLFFLSCLLYPDKIRYSKRELTLRTYEKVLHGILMKFPKNFFSEAEGELNAIICLQYAINQNLFFQSIRELYLKFASRSTIITFLKEVRLYAPCIENYEYPVDMLHDALPEKQKSELYYQYARFLTDFEVARERMKKCSTK